MSYMTTILHRLHTCVAASQSGNDPVCELHTVDDADADYTHIVRVPIELEDLMKHHELRGYSEVHLMYNGNPYTDIDVRLVRHALFKAGMDGEAFEQDDTGLAG